METPRTATLAQLERDAADASQLRHELKKAHNRERALEEQVKKLQDQVQTLSSQLVDAASTATNPAKTLPTQRRRRGNRPQEAARARRARCGTRGHVASAEAELVVPPPPVLADQALPDAEPEGAVVKLELEGHMRRLSVELRKQPETGAYGLGLNDFNAVIDVPPNSSLEQNDLVVEVAGKKLGRGEKLQDCLPPGDTMALVVLRPLLSVPELQKALGRSGYATPDSKAYGLSLKRKTSLAFAATPRQGDGMPVLG